ncbi:MAG: hypothetical protein IJ196_07795, partial [Prevotella sp.]|nr:hypothetical protein [Prevotella sp.]
MKVKSTIAMAFALLAGAANVSAQTSPYQGSVVAAGDEYYLYNVESNMWLQENNRFNGDWNTRGELGAVGFDVKLIANGDGWQIDPKFGHNNSMNGGNWYLDTGDGVTAWTFEPAEVEGVSNAYRIRYNGDYLHATPSPEFKLIRNDVAERHTWQIVTRENRLAYMQTATENDPKDASWLIRANEFSNEDTRKEQYWTLAGSSNRSWQAGRWGGDNTVNSVFETWGLTNMSFTQTLEVPNGKYVLSARATYSPTAGGDMNVDDLKAYLAGTLENHGFLFANDEQVALPSVYSWNGDGPQAHFHSKDLDGTYVIDGVNQFAYTVQFDDNAFYVEVPVTVIDGTLKVGVKVENANGRAWVLADKFRLTYLGEVAIDVSEYIAALEAAITQAEEFKGNTTDILQSNFDTALANAKAALSSTDIDELVAVTSALKDALAAAKAVDDTNLEKTIVFAKQENIDTAEAEEFVKTGTEPGELTRILEALRVARRINGMETLDATFAGNEPTDRGEYYFYNVGRKMFFQHGSDWGTHSALGMPGLLVTLEANGDGYVFHNLTLTSGGKYTNPNGYVDTGEQHVWFFKPVEGKTNVYNIVHQSNKEQGMAFNPNANTDTGAKRFNTVGCWETNLDDEDAQWILVTKADRDALLAKASANNPVDASYMIKGASATKWETDLWKGTSRWGDQNPDFALENWNGGDKTNAYQELNGLKPGKYLVTVQGYYRDGTFENQAANAENPVSFARLYAYAGAYDEAYSAAADEATALLPNILTGLDQAPGLCRTSTVGEFPDGCDQATELFELGLYGGNAVEVEVGVDGKLVIGVMKERENAPGGDWVVLDNFRLLSLGLAPVLDENADNTPVIENAGEVKTVVLKRSTVADTWNTLCVPFDLTEEQITEVFGEGTQVAELNAAEDNTELV